MGSWLEGPWHTGSIYSYGLYSYGSKAHGTPGIYIVMAHIVMARRPMAHRVGQGAPSRLRSASSTISRTTRAAFFFPSWTPRGARRRRTPKGLRWVGCPCDASRLRGCPMLRSRSAIAPLVCSVELAVGMARHCLSVFAVGMLRRNKNNEKMIRRSGGRRNLPPRHGCVLDTRVRLCTDTCTRVCTDMCTEVCTHMCTGMRTDMCIHMCIAQSTTM